jgi:sarcosine oxidase subunit beta
MGLAAGVVVVGGGVIGASVAYHLAARGADDVLVLDRARGPGAGSTGRATGGFRVQFSTAVNVRLSLLARAHFERFAAEVGGDCGYRPAGYLWIAETDAQLASLRAALAVQRGAGVEDAVEVDARTIATLNPALQIAGIAGGTYCPSDGFIRPLQILDGYRLAAQRRGVRFDWEAEVVGFRRASGGEIVAVQTPHGEIATGAVVNAAGAWAGGVAQLAGVDLPVTPLRRQVAVTVPTAVLPVAMPMTLYAGDGFHLRERDGRVLLLLPASGAADPFDDAVDPAWIDAVVALARRRVPALAAVPIDRAACWAGLYEMSPDGNAILGALPAVPNLFHAAGASGHGVMHAPALGRLLAEIVLDGAASSLADVSALRPDRFDAARAPAQIDRL